CGHLRRRGGGCRAVLRRLLFRSSSRGANHSVKLAILTQYYPPEVGAPQSRLSALAREFARRGHQVTVLTAMPNYPTGKIPEGYRGAWMREERDGAMVVRTFLYPTQRTDFAHRLTSYCSFALSSVLWGTFCLEPPDYLLVESPP